MADEAPMKRVAAHYNIDGKIYAVEFQARSLADAQRRAARIRQSLQVDGWPCYSAGFLPGLAQGIAWLLNRRHRRG